MAARGRRAVAKKISRANLFKIGDGFAETVSDDATLFRIAFAFDVPELKHVKEVVKGHAVEIIGIETFLNVAKLHRTQEHLKGVAAAITATGTIRIGFGHDHAFVPHVLGYPVVNVVFARFPAAMI